MYSAKKDKKSVGSTRLHKDVTDAWNVLTHTEPKNKHAEWAIFSRKDTAVLIDWMKRRLVCDGDPVHHQQTFLTQEDLMDLWIEKRIRPYIIHQKLYEFVFIPAGCAHQVRVFETIFIFLLLYFCLYSR
jgi:lysine-specific demethylase 3